MDLSKILTLPIRRAKVRPESVPTMTGLLREDLKDLGWFKQADIRDDILLALIQEACRRAAETEEDKQARYGRVYKEIEGVAREMVAAFQGEVIPDSRVTTILKFHRLL